jgi:hypothetical protein
MHQASFPLTIPETARLCRLHHPAYVFTDVPSRNWLICNPFSR